MCVCGCARVCVYACGNLEPSTIWRVFTFIVLWPSARTHIQSHGQLDTQLYHWRNEILCTPRMKLSYSTRMRFEVRSSNKCPNKRTRILLSRNIVLPDPLCFLSSHTLDYGVGWRKGAGRVGGGLGVPLFHVRCGRDEQDPKRMPWINEPM